MGDPLVEGISIDQIYFNVNLGGGSIS